MVERGRAVARVCSCSDHAVPYSDSHMQKAAASSSDRMAPAMGAVGRRVDKGVRLPIALKTLLSIVLAS